MEALDFVTLVAGVWAAVIALTMTLLSAASRADEAALRHRRGDGGPGRRPLAPRAEAAPNAGHQLVGA
jgi:hypothetical protein